MSAILECRGLTKNYGNVPALAQADLTIEPGRVVGLLGPNGSGKTTLIKLINGLLSPDGGDVRICGLTPGPESRSLVSYLPDRLSLPEWMSADGLLGMYGDFYKDFDRAKAEEMLGRLGVTSKMKVSQMSKGTREKMQLVLAMSRSAMLYLLDEPIGGVDPATRDFILETIIRNYNPNAAVIISTHLITDVEPVLDEAVFLQWGRVILHDSADSIREKTGKSIDAYFREVFKC